MPSPIKLIVTGAAGRMGQRLVALANESSTLKVVGATETPDHRMLGRDLGEIVGGPPTGLKLSSNLKDLLPSCDVVVDFTSPKATLGHIELASQTHRAMVIGTTGFSPDELERVRRSAKMIPCVMAPNMSVGINVLLKVIGQVAQALGDGYDLEIVEAHHHMKKDAPSGTALKLAEALAEAKHWNLQDVGVYARHGMIGERKQKEIGMQTIRAGDIVGDHTVIFGGLGERIEITHRAHNRDPFARGALRAAEWVVAHPPGFYSMADVLGLS